jgi:hypothetical protein
MDAFYTWYMLHPIINTAGFFAGVSAILSSLEFAAEWYNWK